ncbi:MAG: hypothetical protein HQK86_00545 [Nitrospinae bacterium]|nr:hypothetical protein [Nitrospinota bacterium]MBF0635013.1 hypothetical protein [Nitrospinota bacterium]
MRRHSTTAGKTLLLFLLMGHLFISTTAFAVDAKVEAHGFTSSQVCGTCHKDIYEEFSRSLHSLSFTNPIFSMAYAREYLATKGAAKETCLKCHAPTTISTKDADAALPITSEGVTCDFCHSIESVDLASPEPFKLDVAGKKRASMKDAKSPAHSASYAEWFNKSELCAGCHEITSVHGVKTATTYSEWKTSGYAAKGVQCQGCHMPRISGSPADPAIKPSTASKVHDHSLSHNLDTMKGAIKLHLVKSAPSKGERYVVDIDVTNARAGHAVPTGTQPRELILEVTVKDADGRTESQKKTFGKKISGVDGKVITPGGAACVNGKRIIENSSINPGETRAARFMFNIKPKEPVTITANAYLSYAPLVSATEQTLIPLGSLEK